VVLAMPPRKLIRQLMPAPPGLRIFRPLMSSSEFSGFLVVYQFWKPRSSHGPITLIRSLESNCLTTRSPAAPSAARWVTSIFWP
jgi:hypothetical protein